MKRFQTIPNFLAAADAERVHKYLDREMPRDWWYASSSSFGIEGPRRECEGWIDENARRRSVEEEKAACGEFTYFFHRTLDDHPLTCPCLVCDTMTVFRSEMMIRRIAFETELDLTGVKLSFASWYMPGDFLSTHTDKDNGKIAFVWNLTKNWRPQYGGLLQLLNNDWKTVETTITPSFNSLVLFDVRGEGWPHLVSQVIDNVKEKRLAISGWFS